MECGFRKLVVIIQEQLSAEDMETIVYLFKLPDEYKRRSRLDALQYLERHGEFDAHSPDKVEKFLKTINRLDLLCFVDDYKRKEAPASTLSTSSSSSCLTPSNTTSTSSSEAAANPAALSGIKTSLQHNESVDSTPCSTHHAPIMTSSHRSVSLPVDCTLAESSSQLSLTELNITEEEGTGEGTEEGTGEGNSLCMNSNEDLSCIINSFDNDDPNAHRQPSQPVTSAGGCGGNSSGNGGDGGSGGGGGRGVGGRGGVHHLSRREWLRGLCRRFQKGPSLDWPVGLETLCRESEHQRGKPLIHRRAMNLYVESTGTKVQFVPQLFAHGVDGDLGRAATLEFSVQLPRMHLRGVYFTEVTFEVSAHLSNDPSHMDFFSERKSCRLGDRKISFYGLLSHTSMRDLRDTHLATKGVKEVSNLCVVIRARVSVTMQATCVDDGDYVIVNP